MPQILMKQPAKFQVTARATSGQRKIPARAAWRWRAWLAGLAVVIMFFLMMTGVLFLLTWWRDPSLTMVEYPTRPDPEIGLGRPIDYELEIRLPWFRWPLAPLEFSIPENDLAVLAATQPRLGRLGWGTWTWRFEGTVQPLRPGEFAQFRMILRLLPRRTGNEARHVLPVSGFTVPCPLAERTSDSLTMAPPAFSEPVQPTPLNGIGKILGLGLWLAAVVIGTRLLFKQKPGFGGKSTETGQAENVWLRELSGLNNQPGLTAEKILLESERILRSHLEHSLVAINASGTRAEYLSALAIDSRLDEARKRWLREIFILADKVEFGGGTIERKTALKTLAGVRDFIKHASLVHRPTA